jgi:hypothetical protein
MHSNNIIRLNTLMKEEYKKWIYIEYIYVLRVNCINSNDEDHHLI